MKKFLVLIKALVILSGGSLALLRFIAYKYSETISPRDQSSMLILSIVCAGVLAVCGVIWVIIEKKKAKSENDNEP